uniref:Phosphatidic acid phosphatase type 2/haloperoxidase domain-containing protein n=1 Tax=Geospiza parvula TaxID=87175 RepID=A0A8C3MD94_GEOPR
ILGGTAALAYQLEFTDAFPVHAGGFFCRDPDFGRPDPGPPGASRAPPGLVYALVSAVPALTVRGETWGSGGVKWGPGGKMGRVLLGLLATAIFANAGQVVLGTPAPHFLAVCRPNYSALGCGRPSAPAPPRAPGGLPLLRGPPAVAAARRDFPCKEAALGAYAGAFLYVTLAWRGGGSRLAKPAAVLGFAAPPFLLGALRVAEHRNSWGGVLGGFLILKSPKSPQNPPPKIRPNSHKSRPQKFPQNLPKNFPQICPKIPQIPLKNPQKIPQNFPQIPPKNPQKSPQKIHPNAHKSHPPKSPQKSQKFPQNSPKNSQNPLKFPPKNPPKSLKNPPKISQIPPPKISQIPPKNLPNSP